MDNNKNEILDLMLAHHALIETLFAIFRDSLKAEKKDVFELLDNFKWQLEKHFFVEERLVFKFIYPEHGEVFGVVQDLIKEHAEMLNMLAEIESRLKNNENAAISAFYQLLEHHRNTEEQTLYPWMDKALSEFVKKVIVSRISEIALK